MKKLFFIPVLLIMLSCNSNSSDRTVGQQEEQKSDTIKSVTTLSNTKKDSVTGQEKPIDKVDEVDVSKKLIGTWTLKEGENATFEISKSTFYYPEHSTSYKYKIVGDSIKIKYDDFEEVFAFKFKTNDILVLTGDDGENTYYRVK